MCTNIVSVVKSSSLTALSFRAIAISTNETDRYEPGDAEKIVHIDEIWALQHMVVDKYIVQTLEEARALEYATAEIMAARGYLPDARSCHTYAVVVRGLDFQQLESINHPPECLKQTGVPNKISNVWKQGLSRQSRSIIGAMNYVRQTGVPKKWMVINDLGVMNQLGFVYTPVKS